LINLTNKPSEKLYAEVVILEFNLNKTFHYAIPKNLQENIFYGTRVIIPFKNSEKSGCVVGFMSKSKIKNCKNILQVLDEESYLNEHIVRLTEWISKYYLCPWSKVLNYVLPKTRKLWIKQWKDKDVTIKNTSAMQLNKSMKKTIFPLMENDNITEKIMNAITNNFSKVFYSGPIRFSEKLSFYIDCIRAAQVCCKQVIIVTPSEVELIELAQPLKKEFNDKILVYEEKSENKNNFFRWMKIKKSRYDIVIGKRSAVFLPMEKLGLIIVDHEHDSLYKEERAPRYHAVKVAIKRADIEKIPIVLQSNSPSLESFLEIKNKHFEKLEFDNGKQENIPIKNKIIDMTLEKSKKKIISYELQQSILKNLKNGKQIMLFLNRRGFSNFIICNKCGFIPKCPNCQNVLSYHFSENHQAKLVCHHCGTRNDMPKVCPKCEINEMRPLGIGTQQLENEIQKMFPVSRIKRLDRDIIEKKEDYINVVEDFNKRKIDILIGTKIALKEICYDHVNLFGIISADTLLNLPDFRSGEKTFQLIREIISSYRKNDSSKEVIVQTFNPNHHCLLALKKENDKFFYINELKLRKELDYPPFTHIIKMEIKGECKEKIQHDAKSLVNFLEVLGNNKSFPKHELLGARNMIIWKTKNAFRVQIVIKVKNIKKFNRLFQKNIDKNLLNQLDKKNRLIIDVDPLKMI